MKFRCTTITLVLLQFAMNFGLTAISQNKFTFSYSTLSDEMAYDGIETEDGGFIVTVSTGTYSPYLYSTLLIKMNSQGDTIKTISIVKNAGTCMIAELVKDIDGNFFGIGIQESAQETKLWLLKINSDLEFLIDTTYSINQRHVLTFYGFLDHNNQLIFYGGAGIDYGQIHPFVYKLTQNGDSISYMYYPDNGSETVYSMIEKPNSSGYYMMIWGQYQIVKPSPGQILTFNENLEITSIDSLPKEFNMYYNAKIFNNHEFILTGKINIWNDSRRTDLLGIKRLDTSFTWQQSNCLGPADTINYPGYYHNLDFIDTNCIYYGGTCNQALASFSSNKSYFLFGKFDSGLNLQWQKYYGGDQYYSLWGITATSDGGCLLYGSSFNYLTQNMERDVFIVKTDSEGVITGSDEKSDRCFQDLIIYPNPGTDYLVIESGPQVKGDRFILRDLSGSQLIDLQINAPKVSVETKSLSDGTYIWQLISQNRVIDSGKWIKLTK